MDNMELSRFTEIDEAFTCAVCDAEIPPLGYTSRDHCNKCLCSLHVDINPGDRQSNCGGILEPIGAEYAKNAKKGVKILYKCRKCGDKKKNIAAKDDDNEMIIKLFSNPT